jgi:hypothetical protein
MALTEKEWIYRSRAGIPDREECKYCDAAAFIKASWKLTNNMTLSGYLCYQCHDLINREMDKVNRPECFKAA